MGDDWPTIAKIPALSYIVWELLVIIILLIILVIRGD